MAKHAQKKINNMNEDQLRNELKRLEDENQIDFVRYKQAEKQLRIILFKY